MTSSNNGNTGEREMWSILQVPPNAKTAVLTTPTQKPSDCFSEANTEWPSLEAHWWSHTSPDCRFRGVDVK
eukprot:scaffold13337_cov203-Alexandrium_tamarense.AAC.4